jgi:uncharacterized protein
MYNMGDGTYRNQPKVMSDKVVDALLERVKSHCELHEIDSFNFAFHGGEPLLAGENFFLKFMTKANAVLSGIAVTYLLQTNATLLTQEWCEFFDTWKVQIGISLDGTPEANDQFRIDHAGKGSYTRIVAGLKLAQTHRKNMHQPGVLSVVNIQADPVAIYHHFKEINAVNVSFLLPDSNYDKLPPPPAADSDLSKETPYADWLIRLFDAWFNDDKNRLTIQYFRKIIHTILGREIVSELIGTANNEVMVIETDGSIESLDVLKICGEGFTKNNSNVLHHELDEALNTPLANLYQLSHKKVCGKCASCPIGEICGGGYLPHRYSAVNGFNNPSVYCKDLLKLITYIQNKVIMQLPEELVAEAGITLLTYEEALLMLEDESVTTGDSLFAEELEAY